MTALLIIIFVGLPVAALVVSFGWWLTDPWRCDLCFDIFWNHDDGNPEPPVYRIIWLGWLRLDWYVSAGWRGWSIDLHTD